MARKEKVTYVIDGDTFKTANRKHFVRLANVDAPEKGQRGAVAAMQALKQLIQGKDVTIDTKVRDTYGRSVANVKVKGKSVNAAMRRKTGK